MNAKARKKEKRRLKREALRTTKAKEDEALDAALLYDIDPELPPEDEEDSMTDDDADAMARYMVETLPMAFAVALAMRLEEAGHGERLSEAMTGPVETPRAAPLWNKGPPLPPFVLPLFPAWDLTVSWCPHILRSTD